MKRLDQAVDLLNLAKTLLDQEGESVAVYLTAMALEEAATARELRRRGDG
jgi:hypothetical protein